MKEMKYKLASLTAFSVKDDYIINQFCDVASDDVSVAVNAFSNVCKLLLTRSQSLADYLREMLCFSESPLLEAYAREGNEMQLFAIQYDIAVIKDLAKMSAHKVKDYLFKEFNEDFIFSLPEYVCGGFDYNAEYFAQHVRKNGSGIYAKYKAFVYEENKLAPIENPDKTRLSDLKKYEAQRNQIVDNTKCFLQGQSADNVLLYGDRGTGKSSTVKALLNEYESLRMVQVDKTDISGLPKLYKMLKNIPLKFIIFIDDLSFNENDENFATLKKVLEGSISGRPSNILIYATTNRRHLIKETESRRNGDDVHRADEIDENMSLADRFGLFITFMTPNKEVYLEIVRHITVDRGIIIDTDKLYRGAERYALKRNGRSPRVARQYVDFIQSRLALGIELDF